MNVEEMIELNKKQKRIEYEIQTIFSAIGNKNNLELYNCDDFGSAKLRIEISLDLFDDVFFEKSFSSILSLIRERKEIRKKINEFKGGENVDEYVRKQMAITILEGRY